MSRETRRQELVELADRLGLGAVLFQTPANFAWYTGGADNRFAPPSLVGAKAEETFVLLWAGPEVISA